MYLIFGGYGGEYCVGELTSIELDNIKWLLKRFDTQDIVGIMDINFDTSDYKASFYDFDDIMHETSVAVNFGITIESDSKMDDDSFDSSECDDIVVPATKLSDGWYISSVSTEKGTFSGVELDIEFEDFDKDLLSFEYMDLDDCSFGDIILSKVFYDAEELELDYDHLCTNGKGFYQSLIYVENGAQLDGLNILLNDLNCYNILSFDNDNFLVEAKNTFLKYIEAWRSGYLLSTDDYIVFASPFLYEQFEKEKVDDLWMTEKNIKYALDNELRDEIPQDIWDRIYGRFPEWLI